jgi:hypothetical protein
MLWSNLDESIQHLFFDCHIARCIWRVVQVSFNILPPLNIQHMFHNWLQGVDLKLKNKIWVGAVFLKENMRGSPYCALLESRSLCTNKVKKKGLKVH